jgi:hypothetical protein
MEGIKNRGRATMNRICTTAGAALLAFCSWAVAQESSPAAPTKGQPTAGQQVAGGGSLSAEEKTQINLAGQNFSVRKFAEALVIYKPLATAHPSDLTISKLAAESAINVGEKMYALGLLTPIETASANDWQAAALLARIYAESGDKQHRDAEMTHMQDLYNRGIIPASLRQYLLETIQIDGQKTMWIWHSLTPWGTQKVYDYARVFDSSGQVVYRMELESMDIDQSTFAKTNPTEAAAGVRMFSFDSYSPGAANANGTLTSTHATIDMFVGQPTYDAVRKAFIGIASGKYERQATSIFNPQGSSRPR